MNFDEIAQGSEAVYTVSEFLDAVNFVLKQDKAQVRGEVTDFKKGKWISFSLKDKDDNSILKCVLGEWQYRQIGVMLQDGMEVKIKGAPSVSKAYGSFGFWVEAIEPLGEGSLKKAYELLLKQLKSEGLFERKRPIPEFIKNIGVISSKHGVVIHDFRQNLDKRGFKIFFYDSRVEGADAPQEIIKAIRYFNLTPQPPLRRRGGEGEGNSPSPSGKGLGDEVDVIVLIRGGGSLESMQAFNNEAVARAIFASRVPVIAGIGHDVDVPISSLVADLEESTPTGAAQAINTSWQRLQNVGLLEQNIISEFEGSLALAKSQARIMFGDIVNLAQAVISRVRMLEQKVVYYAEKLGNDILNLKNQLSRLSRTIEFANPERNLKLGYSIVRNHRGEVLKSIKGIKLEDKLSTQVVDGKITSIIKEIE